MNDIAAQLHLKLKKSPRIVFLGVGSPLRADDAVGIYIVAELAKKLKPGMGQEFHFCLGESAPENFTGEIRNFKPTDLIIFDAAEINQSPGTFSLIAQDQIEGISFATHILPLKIICRYLAATAGCQVLVVGVQPKLLEFDRPLSPVVKQAADNFITDLVSLF